MRIVPLAHLNDLAKEAALLIDPLPLQSHGAEGTLIPGTAIQVLRRAPNNQVLVRVVSKGPATGAELMLPGAMDVLA